MIIVTFLHSCTTKYEKDSCWETVAGYEKIQKKIIHLKHDTKSKKNIYIIQYNLLFPYNYCVVKVFLNIVVFMDCLKLSVLSS